jgi:isocitrate dehydrogenase
MHQQGKETSTNPIASIFAWACGLKFRGEFDGNQPLITFAQALEEVCVQTVEGGVMTKDLALCIHGEALERKHYVTTEQFLEAIAQGITRRMTH